MAVDQPVNGHVKQNHGLASSQRYPSSDAEPKDRPSYYWTWRLLKAGFSPEECAEIRGIEKNKVLQDVQEAAKNDYPLQSEWLTARQ